MRTRRCGRCGRCRRRRRCSAASCSGGRRRFGCRRRHCRRRHCRRRHRRRCRDVAAEQSIGVRSVLRPQIVFPVVVLVRVWPTLNLVRRVCDVDARTRRHAGASTKTLVRADHREIRRRSDVCLIAKDEPGRIFADPNYTLQHTFAQHVVYVKVKGKGKRSVAVSNTHHCHGNSQAIWDQAVLPATGQR